LSYRPCLLLTFSFKMTRQRQSIRVLSFSYSVFFCILYHYRTQACSTDRVCRRVFPHTKQKEKETVQKNRQRSSFVVVLVGSPSFLISRVNFHCVQQKRRTMASIDGWIDVRKKKKKKTSSTPSPTPYSQGKKRKKKGEEQDACQNHKQ
jgi:hypothetical protein